MKNFKPSVCQAYTTASAYVYPSEKKLGFIRKICYWWLNMLYFKKMQNVMHNIAAETLSNTIIYAFSQQQNRRYEIRFRFLGSLIADIVGYDYYEDLIEKSRHILFSNFSNKAFNNVIYHWLEQYTNQIKDQLGITDILFDQSVFEVIFFEEAAKARNQRHQYYPAQVKQMASAISARMKHSLVEIIYKLNKK